MPQHHRWGPQEFPLAEAKRLRAEGKNLYDIAEAPDWSYSSVRRHLAATGTLETFRHKRRAIPHENPSDAQRSSSGAVGDTERNGNLPATQSPAHPSASERTVPPAWKSQGQQFAEDMLEWVDRYSRESRLEKRQVIDLALRTLRALVEGRRAPDA